MRLGVHVSIAGGLQEAIGRARRLECTAMQIFSRSPRSGKATPLSADLVQNFDRERRSLGIEPLAVHSPYIINLASAQESVWNGSVRLYQEEYQRCTLLNAQYLVTHVGTSKDAGEEVGVEQVAKAMGRTLDFLPKSPLMILLENTAGSGQGLGHRFEQLASIRNRVKAKNRVGFCLDTAHLFAAGYSIHTEEGLEATLQDFDRIIGLKHLRLVHLNDSKVPFGSKVDRHWHIGEGHIGTAAFKRIVNHPDLRGVPFILETPKLTEADDPRNLAMVHSLIAKPSRRVLSHT
ncbi:MAG: deoxyribonuclease IV [Candidatus Omnitrophica bacterium]|nr:deoxyribonuclease IV [Candidatus Omnitrophota bacterium]